MRSASLIPARICWTVRDGAEVGGVDAGEADVRRALRVVLGAVVPGSVRPLGGVVVGVGTAGPPPDVQPVSATTITAAATPMDLTGPLSQSAGARRRACALLTLM